VVSSGFDFIRRFEVSKIRQLLVEAPQMCGLYDAQRWGRIAEIAFDLEVADKESVGARLPDETIPDRLRTVLAWRNYIPSLEGQQIGAYVQNLLVFAALSIDKNTGKPYDESSRENYWKNLKADEARYPQVAAILTVDEASTLDFWN
jgi:hypothetical protein